MTKSRGTKAAAMACAAALILPLAACEERPVETVGTTTTAAIITKAETTTTAETIATVETTVETTTTVDDVAPGHFGVFNGWIMLDGELRAIYPLDALVLIETEEGYSFLYPCDEEFLSVPLTDENLRGVTKKVTDEAEKNGTVYLIQNELETDFDDGMKVYFDGENFCLLIRGDMGYRFISNVQRDYEYQQSLKENDPESYREMEEEGRIIPYDVPNLDLDQIWYAFCPDPNIEPMKPITTEASAEEIAAEETTTTAAATTAKAETTTTTEAEEPSAEDYKYSEADGRITITGYRGSDPKVVIPAVIDGKPVTGIGGNAFYQRDIESVVIPDSVTVISGNAFYRCEKLEKIIIPESVEQIGAWAFEGTPWLEKMRAENPLVIVNGILVDGKLGAVGDVTIPDGVTSIAGNAFGKCETLTSVTIPDSVTEVGAVAFSGCAALENVTLPDHAVKLGLTVFAGTPWLEKKRAENPLVIVNGNLIDGQTCSGEVTIPDGVRSIAEDVFAYSDMKSVTIPDSVTEISDSAFFCCTGLTDVTIPDSVTEISGFAFFGCTALANVTIPDSVARIGYGAFIGCTSLTNITIPDGVTEIGDEAFSQCHSLTSVTIGNGVTVIGDSVFGGCEALTSVTIPDSVTEIGWKAFSQCYALTSVTIGNGVTAIGEQAFFRCNLTSVTLPDGLKSLGEGAFGYGNMTVTYQGKNYVLPTLKDDLYQAVNGEE